MSPKVGAQRVLVTGGGTGIGRAVALAVIAQGGKVLVTGRREAPLRALEAAHSGAAFAHVCDVTEPTSQASLFAVARERLGGVDGFVHCAGQVVHQAFGGIEETALRAQLEVNLVAPLRLCERAIAELDRGGGVVLVSSTLAERPILTSAAYSAAKAGLVQVAKVAALAGAPRQVRVNVVTPGVVDTEMVRTVRLGPGEPMPAEPERSRRIATQLRALEALHPLGRLGQPEEIAEAILHLLTAAWTTGAELRIDGGQLLRE